jgi:hypothetical protein
VGATLIIYHVVVVDSSRTASSHTRYPGHLNTENQAGQNFGRREAPTIEDARRIARDELLPIAEFGRRPMIYAVSPEGWTIHIE